jgi:hypothetical protein
MINIPLSRINKNDIIKLKSMCELCGKAKSIPEYGKFISEMLEKDKERMEFSKAVADELRPVGRSSYSSMKWPVKLVYPMFEARAAYAVPHNYFQMLTLDGERLGNAFAHGAMRSVFFVKDRLVLFSKSVNFREGREFFTSFMLLHLDRSEYQSTADSNGILIKADLEKPMRNLVTGKMEKKAISFSFRHQNVEGRIVSKERAAQSARFKEVYAKYGGAKKKSASMDMEGYAITVHHFSPHPYLLQLHKEFGFEDNKDFQLHVADYLKEHLGL